MLNKPETNFEVLTKHLMALRRMQREDKAASHKPEFDMIRGSKMPGSGRDIPVVVEQMREYNKAFAKAGRSYNDVISALGGRATFNEIAQNIGLQPKRRFIQVARTQRLTNGVCEIRTKF